MNTAIFSGGQGIGFAVPINMAKALVPQLKSGGRFGPGLARRGDPEGSGSCANALKESEGALVSDVIEDSPAGKADIRRGDVIVAFNGTPIKDMEQLPRAVASVAVGKKVKVKLLREGKTLEVEVTIAEGREEKREARTGSPDFENNFGLVAQNITADIARHLGHQRYSRRDRDGRAAGQSGGRGRHKAGRHRQGDKQKDSEKRCRLPGHPRQGESEGRNRHAREKG